VKVVSKRTRASSLLDGPPALGSVLGDLGPSAARSMSACQIHTSTVIHAQSGPAHADSQRYVQVQPNTGKHCGADPQYCVSFLFSPYSTILHRFLNFLCSSTFEPVGCRFRVDWNLRNTKFVLGCSTASCEVPREDSV